MCAVRVRSVLGKLFATVGRLPGWGLLGAAVWLGLGASLPEGCSESRDGGF